MGLGAEALFLQPFGDVVMLANTALINSEAEHDERMIVAARALVREAERAKRKVEAVWESEVEKHGDAFRAMMVQQGSVETKRFHLESLLWDFEDVVHPDNFEPHRYKTLQAAVRALALDVVETSKRLNPSILSAPPTPTGGFPPLPPLPLRPPKARKRSLRSGDAGTSADPQPGSSSDTSPPEIPGAVNLDTFLDALWEEKAKGGAPPGRRATPKTSSDSMNDTATLTAVESDTVPSSPSLDDDTSNLITPTQTAEAEPLTRIASASEATLFEAVAADAPSKNPKTVSEDGPMMFNEFIGEEIKAPQIEGHRNTKLFPPRTPDCTIRDDSTYHRLKGLCSGAVRFRRDGHWGSIVRTTEYGQGGDMLRASDGIMPFHYEEVTKVARCGDCSYSHNLDEVIDDMDGKATANHPSPHGSAHYRLRLLFKSHLRAGSLPGPSYACIWCIHANTTVRAGDATVFLSADDLLRHLASHPQPFPALQGTKVLYGGARADAHPDFDLHLPESPLPVPMPYNVTNLATAVATRDEYRRPGRTKLERPPGYAGEMLEFLEGATLVGVMFPEKWDAKWCLGRHDGVFGAFPAKAVEVRLPEEGEVPAGEGSGMKVTARWKWPPGGSSSRKGAGTVAWLSFAKGEVIHDVQCVHGDYWVWSGTNSKGKTGVFPRSHVVLDTLQPESSGQSKAPKRRGLFSRAGSTSSR